MSTTGNQTITVNSVDRTYVPAWAAKYAADLKKGNTVTKKTAITNGVSIYRLAHNASNGIERHILSVEDEVQDSEGASHLAKVQVTITCDSDDSAEAARLSQLVSGVAAYLQSSGVLDSILADEL